MATDAPAIPPFLKIALTTARPLLARSLVVVPPQDLADTLVGWARGDLTPAEQQALAAVMAAAAYQLDPDAVT